MLSIIFISTGDNIVEKKLDCNHRDISYYSIELVSIHAQ